MTDVIAALAALSRPRLLLAAARHGLAHYSRDRDLSRILRARRLPDGPDAVFALMSEEARLDDIRRAGEDGYSVRRHVAVLIALLAEARALFGRSPSAV